MTFILLFLIMFSFTINAKADTTYTLGNIAEDTKNVAVRVCASTSCDILKSDTKQDIYISYPESFEITGEEGNFYKITLQYSGFWYSGFILKNKNGKEFVNKKEVTVTDALINEYQTMGFPLSYATKIATLKALHPNWNFIPYSVNATYDEVIAGETKYISTNLINGNNVSLRNTEDGAYVDGVYQEFAGGGWYSASKQTIKYYVDPRNFLNDGHVFMFEVLGFDEKTQTLDVIQAMLNNTFMSGDAFYINDAGEKVSISYAQTFYDSGKTNTVSAIHLVSRVIQEQGSNGSALSSGDDKEFPGFYNFFNIKANGETAADVIHNGLAHAKKKNWNSPYAAIIGGGNLLGDYVTYGQNTLYLQKFDLAGDSYYTNQYMQNVRAPYTESYSSYKAYYKTGFLDSNFMFSVPVFKGEMPELTSLSEEYSEDATLSMLSVTGCNLMPSFISSAYEYTCNVSKDTTKVTINAVATDINSTITGMGNIDLNIDEQTNEVVVTSKGGSTKVYKITIKKLDEIMLTPDEILAKLQINNDGGFISGFDLGSDAKSLNDLIYINYPNAKSEINVQSKLSTGMTLKLTSNGTSDYAIVMYGDNNGDGEIDIVDLLKLQKHILGVNKVTDAYLKASDVNKDGVVDIVDLLKVQKHILNVSKIEQ